MQEHSRDIAVRAGVVTAAVLAAAAMSTGAAGAAEVSASDVRHVAAAQPDSALGLVAARVAADAHAVSPRQNHNK
ncbi:hypothetical protein ACH5A3_11420 [Streptomyces echinatus]|uniref:hypothetical protein n=1 Tax=Streptomyces echinatus TaxID=67293 RepID=UPI0037975FEE